MTDTQRFIKIIDWLKDNRKIYNNADLAAILGVSQTYISLLFNGKKPITDNLVKNLFNKFNEINPDWVLSGEGEMISFTSTPTGMMSEAQLRERIIALEKVIEEKDKRIAELQDGQEARINDLQEKVNTLAMALAEAMRKDR